MSAGELNRVVRGGRVVTAADVFSTSASSMPHSVRLSMVEA